MRQSLPLKHSLPGQSVLVRWDGPVPVTTNKTTTLNTSLNAADANTAYFQFLFRCFGEITVSLDRILPSRWVRCFGCQTFQLFINSYFLSLLRTGTVCWGGWVAVFAWLGAVFSRTPQVEKTGQRSHCRSEGRLEWPQTLSEWRGQSAAMV